MPGHPSDDTRFLSELKRRLAISHTEIVELQREELLQRPLDSGHKREDLVVEIFEFTGKRHHIGEIQKLLAHRYEFGPNPQSEICAALGADPRFARCAKGTYELSVCRTSTFGEGSVADKVVRLLVLVDGPVHYSDIYVYLSREVEAGGENPASSLCSRFRYDPRIKAVGGGYYSLVT